MRKAVPGGGKAGHRQQRMQDSRFGAWRFSACVYFETESAGAFCGQGGVLPFVAGAAVDRTDITDIGKDPESPASAVIRIC